MKMGMGKQGVIGVHHFHKETADIIVPQHDHVFTWTLKSKIQEKELWCAAR